MLGAARRLCIGGRRKRQLDVDVQRLLLLALPLPFLLARRVLGDPAQLESPGGGRHLLLSTSVGRLTSGPLGVLGGGEVLPLHLRLVVAGLAVVKSRLPLGVEGEAASTLGDGLAHVLILEQRGHSPPPSRSSTLTSITAIWVIELSAPPPPPPPPRYLSNICQCKHPPLKGFEILRMIEDGLSPL